MEDKELFLLGGRDLEMCEIEKILKENGKNYENKHLSWGAKLSSYKEHLDFDGKIYGVELIEDIEPPKNYIAIDHHNERFKNESSLEQIAKILGIRLSREQKLIAANDKESITGMKKLCATDEKIKDIRQRDRRCQGVSEEEEEIAEREIKNLENEDGIFILKTTLKHFSPLVDRIDKRPLVIYNDEEISVYANQSLIEDLIGNFRKDISKNLCYYGGNPLGYFGFSKEYFQDRNLDETLKKVIDLLKKEIKIYSYHTFMCPFIFKKEDINRSKKWEYKKFEIKEQRDYNEFFYFYKHVQDVLYNIDEENSDNFASKYYEYEDQNGKYIIDCIRGVYELDIDGISLRIFNTNVGILSFNLINKKYKNSEDILNINDFGRRIYPQFLGEDFVCATKNVFLANKIIIRQPESDKEIVDDFMEFGDKKNLKIGMNLLPKYIKSYLDGYFEDVKPIIDDRMFVISFYLSDVVSSRLKEWKKGHYGYESDDWWYKYIFVDNKDKSCQSKHMCKELIKKSTYDRWVEQGTLFGISRYSFVGVAARNWISENVLLMHIKTMYFQLFTLLLVYRASIIKFSNDIQDVTQKDSDEIIQEAQNLYEKYLKFLNKVYFNEVTAQEQGIELFDQALEIMKIDRNLNDLDREINELHSYVEMIENKKETLTINKLTKLGTIFLPGTFIAGIFGMNVFPDNTINNYFWLISSLILILFITLWLGWVHNIEICKFLGCNLARRNFLNFVKSKKEKNEQI